MLLCHSGIKAVEFWVTEKQTPDLSLSIKARATLFHKSSNYQDILIVDTLQHGKVLLLDNKFQTADVDEFIYHEMIAHVALYSHPAPSKVLVIGGGDGGAVREVLKHRSVELVELVEIDRDVIEASKKCLPHLSSGFSDHRCKIIIADGIEYIKNMNDSYDIIIVDSTDPVGPAANLFTEDFYTFAYASLKADGILVSQTESPFLHIDFIVKINKTLSAIFPVVRLYLAPIPTYPSGLWSFTVGSKKYDPLIPSREKSVTTNYYTTEIHKASFAIPKFLENAINTGKAI